eukprot:COSAG01_NODE_7261_length_3278_cov_1.618119_3_plen_50_part_00
MLEAVFGRLDEVSLGMAAQVCRQWRSVVCAAEPLWHELAERRWSDTLHR